MRVVFRVDSSSVIGTGHVMRCLSLAHCLKKRNWEIGFVCRAHKGNANALVKNHGYELFELKASVGRDHSVHDSPNKYLHWLGANQIEDAYETLSVIGYSPNLIIVDHYALDIAWENVIRNHCARLLVIDDLADRSHNCTYLLDQNFVDHYSDRYQGKVNSDCISLLGPKYALLQPEYSELRDKIASRDGGVRRILVNFGGTDEANLTSLAIDACRDLNVELDVVISARSAHLNHIRTQVSNLPQVTLFYDLPSLAHLMLAADLAIGAAGTSSWERCCLRLPAIVVTLAENQIAIADNLNKLGLIKWIGDRDTVRISDFRDALRSFLTAEIHYDWPKNYRALVDGLGAQRIAELLSLNSSSQFKLRAADLADSEKFQHAIGNHSDDYSRTIYLEILRNPRLYMLLVVETQYEAPLGFVIFFDTAFGLEFGYKLNSFISSDELLETVLVEALRCAHSRSVRKLRVSPYFSVKKYRCLQYFHRVAKNAIKSISLTFCSDSTSWLNEYVPKLILQQVAAGYTVCWVHQIEEAPHSDLCFYLSYSKIVSSFNRSKFKSNLVVHESDLPTGRGWAPMTWQILNGAETIVVSLIKADEHVDSGEIYLQQLIHLNGTELCMEWRKLQAYATINICDRFISSYPKILETAKVQSGSPTYFRKRTDKDSELDPNKSIVEQFRLLRVVDNDRYPAYFHLNGCKYRLAIFKEA